MLFFFSVGQIAAQQNKTKVDTVLRITSQQIINANKTKLFADSCAAQRLRIQATVDKCIDLIKTKDGENQALRHSLSLCEEETRMAKKDAANAISDAKKQKFLRKVNGGMVYVEAAIILGLGIYIIINH